MNTQVIDVVISGEKHVNKKETERIIRYKVVTIEIQRKWTANKRSFGRNCWGDGNQLRTIQTVLEGHTEKEGMEELL